MSDIPPEWDNEFGTALHGALVLVGITRETGATIMHQQFFGIVTQANAEGVELMLGGTREGERYRLPPDPRAFDRADPGAIVSNPPAKLSTTPIFCQPGQ